MSQNQKSKVLIADDEKDIREILAQILEKDYEVRTAGNGEEALNEVRLFKPHVVLADLMMPVRDGFSFCKELRKNSENDQIKVIMISAYNDENSRTRAFELGADDFIAKPFSREELLARLNSKVRRSREMTGRTGDQRTCGNLVLDLPSMEVRVDGDPRHLSILEFDLLRFFVENMGKVLSRKEILESVWKDSNVTDRTVDTHIAGLRKRLTGFSCNIQTIYGAGYILKA